MRTLIDRDLDHYRLRTARGPRRVVVHKTTAFDEEELASAGTALDNIPEPLNLVTDADLVRAATDVMGLTKLNWNSAADHTQFPVTLAFAQKVGTIMDEVPDDQEPQTRFSYYI